MTVDRDAQRVDFYLKRGESLTLPICSHVSHSAHTATDVFSQRAVLPSEKIHLLTFQSPFPLYITRCFLLEGKSLTRPCVPTCDTFHNFYLQMIFVSISQTCAWVKSSRLITASSTGTAGTLRLQVLGERCFFSVWGVWESPSTFVLLFWMRLDEDESHA